MAWIIEIKGTWIGAITWYYMEEETCDLLKTCNYVKGATKYYTKISANRVAETLTRKDRIITVLEVADHVA